MNSAVCCCCLLCVLQERRQTSAAASTAAEEGARLALKAAEHAAKLREEAKKEREELARKKGITFAQKVGQQEGFCHSMPVAVSAKRSVNNATTCGYKQHFVGPATVAVTQPVVHALTALVMPSMHAAVQS